MKKRLTVHLINVPKTKKTFKGTDGTEHSKMILTNTLAFEVNSDADVASTLKQLQSNGSNISKHYLSNIK